jgi:hypothetical protein
MKARVRRLLVSGAPGPATKPTEMGQCRRYDALVRRPLLVVVLLGVLVLGSCGSSDSKGTRPSAAAKMVCSKEAQTDITAGIGEAPTNVTTPTWNAHVYSCTYEYRDGKIPVSVKELPSEAETTAYVDGLAKKLGRRPGLVNIGPEGAFQTTDGSVILSKDHKVLDVDGSHLPARFGRPPAPRADVTLSVAQAIMDCWTGA